MSKLANEIWEKHIDTFRHFDLVCTFGDLEEETRSNSLFNALTTLRYMYEVCSTKNEEKKIKEAIEYLEKSKYYSDNNLDALY